MRTASPSGLHLKGHRPEPTTPSPMALGGSVTCLSISLVYKMVVVPNQPHSED